MYFHARYLRLGSAQQQLLLSMENIFEDLKYSIILAYASNAIIKKVWLKDLPHIIFIQILKIIQIMRVYTCLKHVNNASIYSFIRIIHIHYLHKPCKYILSIFALFKIFKFLSIWLALFAYIRICTCEYSICIISIDSTRLT